MKRKWLVLFLAAIALTMAVVFSITLRPKTPEQLLLAKATRLKGGPGVRNAMQNDYQWVDSNRIFAIGETLYSLKDGSGSEYGMQPVFVNMATGVETPLKSLIASFDGRFWYNTQQYKVSPDGQTLLFQFNGAGNYGWTTTSWNGVQPAPKPAFAHAATYGYFLSESAAWLPDSKSWGELAPQADNGLLTLHTLATGHSASIQLQTPACVDPGVIVGFTRSHHMITQGEANNQSTVFMDWTIQGKTAAGKILSGLPSESDEVALSPDGDKLAWSFQSSQVNWIGRGHPRIRHLLQQLHLSLHPTVTTTTALWVSNTDGSQMHPITPSFYLRTFPPSAHEVHQPDYPRNLHWMPDSKRISFDYKNAVYTIPAE